MENKIIDSLELRAITRCELADEYGTTAKTIVRKLKKKNIILPLGRIYPNTLKTIYLELGIPGCIQAKLNGKIDNSKKKGINE